MDRNSRFAVIKTGGKQYRVEEGDVIDVELLHLGDGEAVEFNDVLCLCDDGKAVVGTPNVKGCVVLGRQLGTSVGPKETSVKYTPRQRNYRKFGHRQKYTAVEIEKIKVED